MRLDRIAAVIRPRRYPEAVDLGFRMARAWWRPIIGAWGAVGGPGLALLAAALYSRPELVVLVIWWSKPVFDRVAVFVFGRALFSELPTLRQTLRAWPGLLRGGLPASLSWMRFDLFRSFRLPVWQLERQHGAVRRKRMRLLIGDVRGEAMLLTLICALFELCVFSGLLLLLLMLFGEPDWLVAWQIGETLPDVPLAARWTVAGCYLIAVVMIEPFYVAGGFALYINRRTHLEAWDIEVVFRRMAARLEDSRQPLAVLFAAISLCLLLSTAGPACLAQTGDASAAATSDPDPQSIIAEILEDPIFGSERTETVWSFPEPEPAEPSRPMPLDWLLGEFAGLLGFALRATIVGLAIAALVWGLQFYARNRGPRRIRPTLVDDEPLPAEVLGLDVREASLPEDIVGEAGRLWDEGGRAEAVRLLYRASLARLIVRDGLPVRQSDTEDECLQLVEHHRPPVIASYFRELTEVWQLAAYGHREPGDEVGSGLIRDWAGHFGDPP